MAFCCERRRIGHIDHQPLGDIAGAMIALIAGNPDIDFVYTHYHADRVFSQSIHGRLRRKLMKFQSIILTF
jgi:hypothetical protein